MCTNDEMDFRILAELITADMHMHGDLHPALPRAETDSSQSANCIQAADTIQSAWQQAQRGGGVNGNVPGEQFPGETPLHRKSMTDILSLHVHLACYQTRLPDRS